MIKEPVLTSKVRSHLRLIRILGSRVLQERFHDNVVTLLGRDIERQKAILHAPCSEKKTKDKTWENGRKIQICEMQSYKQVNILILVQKHLKNIIYYIFTLHSGISLQVIKGSNWHCIKAVMQKLQIIIHLENHSIGQTRSTLFSHFVKSTNFALIKCKNCHSTKYIALIYCSKHSESQI